MRFHFCVTVWGTQYVDQFDRYCLASLLTDDNFARVAREHDCCLFVYTRDEDVPLLARGRNLSHVQTILRVVYVTEEASKLRVNTNHWTPWRRAYANAFAAKAALIVIIPDVVYVSDALARIAQKLLEGASLVEFPIPQVTQELVVPFLDRQFRCEDGRIALGDADILSIFQQFIHPKHACALIASPCFTSHPEYILTRAGAGFRIREVGSHPLAILPRCASIDSVFVSVSAAPQSAVLECLGLSIEAMLKYHQLYSHWVATGHRRARLINLGSWATHFRKPGNLHYSLAGSVIDGQRIDGRPPITGFAELRSIYHISLVNVAEAVYSAVQSLAERVSENVLQLALLPLLSGCLRRRMLGHNGLTIFVPETIDAERLLEMTKSRHAAERFFAQHCIHDDLFVRVGTQFALAASHSGGHYETIYSEILEVAENDPAVVRGKVTACETVMDGSRRGYVRLCVFEPCVDSSRTGSSPAERRALALTNPRRIASAGYHAFMHVPVLRVVAFKARNAYRVRKGKPPLVYAKERLAERTMRDPVKRVGSFGYHAFMRVPGLRILTFKARNVYRARKGKSALSYKEERSTEGASYEMRERVDTALRGEVDSMLPRGHTNSAIDVGAAAPDPEIYEHLSISCLVQDTQAIVARFNDAASLMETPVSCLLNQLRGHFDQGIDWAAVESDRNLLVRMKGALRAASDGDLQKAAEICEPLSSDPDYFEHSLESPQHRDAYARAMEFKARSCCSRGSRNEALGYYLRALRVDPERTVLACRVAEILWQLDRIPEALKLMRIGLGSEGNALQRLPSGVPLGKLQHFIDEITAPEASGPEASGGNDEKSRRGMFDVSNF